MTAEDETSPGRGHRLRRRIVPVALVCSVAVSLTLWPEGTVNPFEAPGAPGTSQARPPDGRHYAFGTLISLPGRASAESRRGIKVAMVEFTWKDFEPSRGHFDRRYAAFKRAEIQAMRRAGRRVTLGLGLHYPPAWVRALPRSRLRDQHGHRSNSIDLVFNRRLRGFAARYVREVATVVPMRQVWAVRVTSGGAPEVLYPGKGSYWAFGPNARNGPDMPSTMARNPAPRWRPGTRTVSRSTVRRWADWYIGALDDVVGWQMRTLDSLGFRGWYQVLTPGQGASPRQYRKAVNAYLPDGVVGVGAAWYQFYTHLPRTKRVVAYVTSVADRSGGNDLCRRTDRRVSVYSPAVESWSATRWISRVADAVGIPKNGENPGWQKPVSHDAHYRDPSRGGMMATSFRQIRSCGFQGMYWAHDRELWNGISSIDRYAALVRAANGSTSPLPPPAPAG